MTAVDVAREGIEAFNQGDWERLRRTLADNCIYDELATQRHVEGADAVVEANRGWKEAFPDAMGRIEHSTMGDDGTVTLEITWEGTQAGPLHAPTGDIPPSNRHIVVKAAQVVEVEGDKIREFHHYFDMMGLMRQLGVMH